MNDLSECNLDAQCPSNIPQEVFEAYKEYVNHQAQELLKSGINPKDLIINLPITE
jgi:hypothetical protein